MSQLVLEPHIPLAVANKRPYHFIIVGVGGTGGFLVPNLARLVYVTRNSQMAHEVTLIDGDEVEEKNIKRQNFVNADVSKNKAATMSQRYSGAFGIPITAYPTFLEHEKDLYNIVNSSTAFPVIVGCVDNNKTRQMIHSVFKSGQRAMFWLDSGNEEWAGQVVLGYNSPYKEPEAGKIGPQEFYLPPITEVFPDVMQDQGTKFNSEMSCDERAVSAPQSISANLTASNILMNFLNIMLTAPKEDGLRFSQVNFNAKLSTFSTVMNTMTEIKARRTA